RPYSRHRRLAQLRHRAAATDGRLLRPVDIDPADGILRLLFRDAARQLISADPESTSLRAHRPGRHRWRGGIPCLRTVAAVPWRHHLAGLQDWRARLLP